MYTKKISWILRDIIAFVVSALLFEVSCHLFGDHALYLDLATGIIYSLCALYRYHSQEKWILGIRKRLSNLLDVVLVRKKDR